MTLTIEGVMVEEDATCRWCGRDDPKPYLLAPEGSRVGPVPLHMLCSGAFMLAYRRMRAGLTLSPGESVRVRAFVEP